MGPHIDSNGEQAQFLDQGYGKSGSSVFYESVSPHRKVPNDVNGFHLQPEGFVEFGSVGQLPLVVPLQESSRLVTPVSFSSQIAPTQRIQKSEPELGTNQDR